MIINIIGVILIKHNRHFISVKYLRSVQAGTVKSALPSRQMLTGLYWNYYNWPKTGKNHLTYAEVWGLVWAFLREDQCRWKRISAPDTTSISMYISTFTTSWTCKQTSMLNYFPLQRGAQRRLDDRNRRGNNRAIALNPGWIWGSSWNIK